MMPLQPVQQTPPEEVARRLVILAVGVGIGALFTFAAMAGDPYERTRVYAMTQLDATREQRRADWREAYRIAAEKAVREERATDE